MAATLSSSNNSSTISPHRIQIYRSPLNLGKFQDTHFRFLGSLKRNPGLKLEASKKSFTSTQELPLSKMEKVAADTNHQQDLFDEMKNRFLSYKKEKCLENLDNFQKLSKGQAPKVFDDLYFKMLTDMFKEQFMVIACADSRVCPSSILGFESGEAFMVRNVGNLVPPFENGPSETNAALEFAVNSLAVENLFVIGHSCCGGIRALMSLQNDTDSSTFIKNWVVIGKRARLSTEASAANLSFDQQCRHCEKESVNHSMVNLLTYPWVEERARKGLLTIHGGYYDFVNCTFEKWTLDYKGNSVEEGGKYSIRDQAFWS